jgi:catechol 2,3-dioxygenase-like lactoylglutathione lyase family enzyme
MEETMLTERRVHPTIPTSDLAKTRRFYEDVLGFEPMRELPFAVLYQAGEGSLFAVSRSSGATSGTHTQMAFTTPDIEAEVAALRARGVRFEEYSMPSLTTVDGIADMDPIRAAWFKDPEGNLLGLIQFPDGG